MTPITQLKTDLQRLGNTKQREILQGFFKTKKGQYGEGDVFLGITTPVLRTIAKKYNDLTLPNIGILLTSKIHEHRMVAIRILIDQYERADSNGKKIIFNFCIKNRAGINNWDLVDTAAPEIIGNYLINTSREPLYRLAKSKNLWDRRIAIVATYAFIKEKDFTDTINIATILLHDRHDLIHKAVGWMLREVGNRNRSIEERFLKKHYAKMPRTMLRYAIEKFPETKRQAYLHHTI